MDHENQRFPISFTLIFDHAWQNRQLHFRKVVLDSKVLSFLRMIKVENSYLFQTTSDVGIECISSLSLTGMHMLETIFVLRKKVKLRAL